MRYLLDTNTIIHIVNRRDLLLQDQVASLAAHAEILVSSITYAELMYGLEKSKRRESNAEKLHIFLEPYEVISFEISAAEEYGKIKMFLFKQGTPIGGNDLLIAAHALALDAVLVTNNRTEFDRVPRLRVEDWVKSPPV